jgi:hypothetical protein
MAAANEADRHVLLEALLLLTLSVDTTDARTAVAECLPSLGSTRSPALTSAMLVAAVRRSYSEKVVWLDALDPGIAS